MVNKKYYIGVMSGTSADGIDTVIVSFEKKLTIVGHAYKKFSNAFSQEIISLNKPSPDEIVHSHIVGNKIAKYTAALINKMLVSLNLKSNQIQAIGFHGCTIRHQPKNFMSIQLGNAHLLAKLTNIKVISDFRNGDIASKGQGAPLIPLFHKFLLEYSKKNNAIFLNLGGFANITVINGKEIFGYDCGPGNIYLDYWIKKHKNQRFDDLGNWAQSGQTIKVLLQKFLNDPYFSKRGPKSIGRDYFNEKWLLQNKPARYPAQNVQRTLAELTADTCAKQINKYKLIKDLYICGGGTQNQFLIDLIREKVVNKNIFFSSHLDIDPQLIEPAGFAWLAMQYIENQKLNYQKITGSNKANIIGIAYPV